MYPSNWPRCVSCDDFALDGHLTCGRAECDESKARDERDLHELNLRIDAEESAHLSSIGPVDA